MAKITVTSAHKSLPYNPNYVDIRQEAFSVNDMVKMIKAGEIELWRKNDFQRLSGLWNNVQKSRLIESLIMRIPLPIFYLDGSSYPWKIIDGLQRLTILDEFINKNSFKLTDLQYITELEDCHFDTLSFQYQRIIRNFEIQAYIINPGTPESVKFNIFQRINTTGIQLNKQELRNGYFSGAPVEFINSLASDPAFLKVINGKLPTKRMKDKEFALRFYSFYSFLEEYSKPMDNFLDRCMASIHLITDDQKNDIHTRFSLAMDTAFEIFGMNAFYFLNTNGGTLTLRPNIALFEIWAVNLASLDSRYHKRLIVNKKYVISKFIEYLQDKDFYRSTHTSTTLESSVNLRFSMITDLINISL
jgi:hypothetical protein